MKLTEIYQTRLIELYAVHSLSDINNDPNKIVNLFASIPNITKPEHVLQIEGYNEFNERLITAKTTLEKNLQAEKEAVQVQNCLATINTLKHELFDNKCSDIFIKLVWYQIQQKGLWIGFPSLKEQFKKGVEMIDEWVDFFLSYTNRGQPDLNNDYTPELRGSFKRAEWDKYAEDVNMIAKLIVRNLKFHNNLNAFFDRESMVCGDNIAGNVYTYCEKTFAFAQLLEPMTFCGQCGINWCYNEYDKFSKHASPNKKKFFFKTHNIPVPPSLYQNWWDDTQANLRCDIGLPFDKIALQKNCNMIASEIRETKKIMIQDYIASIN